MRTRPTLAALAVTAAAALLAGGLLAPKVDAQWNTTPDPDAPTTLSCRAVAAEMEIMATDLLALDATIAHRAQNLHASSPEARVDALVAVTQELIDQRRATMDYLKGAHQKLLVHLVEHAVAGDHEAARAALAACPIVKRMTAAEATGAPSRP